MQQRSVQFIIGSLALFGFLSVTLFWSAGMHQGGKHHCIAADIQNGVCPNATTPAAAVFHAQTLQSLISNVLQSWQHFGALLALIFVALIGIASMYDVFSSLLAVRRDETHTSDPPRQFRSWLAHLEHSPSMVCGRV